MTITLDKGQTLNLSKEKPGLTKVFMGLGWDAATAPAAPEKKKGFLGSLLGGAASAAAVADIDLDASVVMLDGEKNVVDTVSFSQLASRDGSIKHSGDNRTGDADGDDEVIHVDLTKINPKVQHLVFVVNSYSGQKFNEVQNATARLVDEGSKSEVCKYVLAEQGAYTAVVMATLSKAGSTWSMKAIGDFCNGRTVRDLVPAAQSAV
ncbi:MAG: TerD family protein [Roseibium sp.]|uniref:TerD family protein n=1 Tax=Alphaproteobacteria TaxID=28211 RepID=UPI0032985562